MPRKAEHMTRSCTRISTQSNVVAEKITKTRAYKNSKVSSSQVSKVRSGRINKTKSSRDTRSKSTMVSKAVPEYEDEEELRTLYDSSESPAIVHSPEPSAIMESLEPPVVFSSPTNVQSAECNICSSFRQEVLTVAYSSPFARTWFHDLQVRLMAHLDLHARTIPMWQQMQAFGVAAPKFLQPQAFEVVAPRWLQPPTFGVTAPAQSQSSMRPQVAEQDVEQETAKFLADKQVRAFGVAAPTRSQSSPKSSAVIQNDEEEQVEFLTDEDMKALGTLYKYEKHLEDMDSVMEPLDSFFD